MASVIFNNTRPEPVYFHHDGTPYTQQELEVARILANMKYGHRDQSAKLPSIRQLGKQPERPTVGPSSRPGSSSSTIARSLSPAASSNGT